MRNGKDWLAELKANEQRKQNDAEEAKLFSTICDLKNLLDELHPLLDKLDSETDGDVKEGLLLLAKVHIKEALSSIG